MRAWMALGVAASLVLGAQSASGQEPAGVAEWVSGNVAMTSDYVFRGITQSLGDPAVQGGIDLKHPSGLYLGTWGSAVNFGEDLADGPRAAAEMDLYGGFGFDLGGIAALDLGGIYYGYPGAGSRNYDFVEAGLGASRSFGPLGAGLSLRYSPDFFAGSGDALYYGASASFPLSALTLSGSVGQQNIEENDTFGTPDYLHWGAGASFGWSGFTIGGQVIGTDLDEEDCFGGSEYCKTRVVLNVSRSM